MKETVILQVGMEPINWHFYQVSSCVYTAPQTHFFAALEKEGTPHLSPLHKPPYLKTTLVPLKTTIAVLKNHMFGWYFKVYRRLIKAVTSE